MTFAGHGDDLSTAERGQLHRVAADPTRGAHHHDHVLWFGAGGLHGHQCRHAGKRHGGGLDVLHGGGTLGNCCCRSHSQLGEGALADHPAGDAEDLVADREIIDSWSNHVDDAREVAAGN